MPALLRSKGTGTHAEIVGGGCCATCRKDDGQAFAIKEELRAPRLPHARLSTGPLRVRVVAGGHAGAEAPLAALGFGTPRRPAGSRNIPPRRNLESGDNPQGATASHADPRHHDARDRPHRRLLHDDPARPARPRPGRRRLLAQRGAGARPSASAGASRESTTDMEEAIRHPETDIVVVALPNHLHEEAVMAVAAAGKAVLCTKPLGRTADEARRMLEVVEKAGVFGGYLEDLCYTPKTLKAIKSVQDGALGDVHWVRSRETHPGPHSAWFWDGRHGRRRRDRRPRLPLHRDHPQLRRQGEPAGRGDVLGGHAGAPDRGRGQRHRPDPVRERRDRPVRGQLDVPRRHGPARRGGRHRGHDLAQPLPAHRLRDVHRRRRGRLRRREGRDRRGLAVPGRRRGRRAGLRRHVHRHVRRHGRRARRPRRRSTTATSSTP